MSYRGNLELTVTELLEFMVKNRIYQITFTLKESEIGKEKPLLKVDVEPMSK